MFSAYQIKNISFENSSTLLTTGKELEQAVSSKISKSLDSFLSPTGSVDAALMMSDWFPNERFDIFISHSRADKDLALQMSVWLKNFFGLTAFIDSCVWMHADKLLKKMDKEWCYQDKTETYSYESRNITTTHVHMMLAAALTKMMDQCECIFFLHTDNSVRRISPKEMVQGGNEFTQSPWLFHEIAMMKLLRRKEKQMHRETVTNFSEGVKKSASVPDFKYPADLEGVPALGIDELKKWMKLCEPYRQRGISNHDTHPLDLLYTNTPPDK